MLGEQRPRLAYKTHHDRRFRSKQDRKEGEGGAEGEWGGGDGAVGSCGSRRMAAGRRVNSMTLLFVSHHEEYVKKMGKMGICCMEVLYNTRKGPVFFGTRTCMWFVRVIFFSFLLFACGPLVLAVLIFLCKVSFGWAYTICLFFF